MINILRFLTRIVLLFAKNVQDYEEMRWYILHKNQVIKCKVTQLIYNFDKICSQDRKKLKKNVHDQI